jgi:hypothetical protein
MYELKLKLNKISPHKEGERVWDDSWMGENMEG